MTFEVVLVAVMIEVIHSPWDIKYQLDSQVVARSQVLEVVASQLALA